MQSHAPSGGYRPAPGWRRRLAASGQKATFQRVISQATTAFSKARGRVPLAWVRDLFPSLGTATGRAGSPKGGAAGAVVGWLDAADAPLGRPAQHFAPHRTRRKQSYWCVARGVVGFCASSGVAWAAQRASLHQSEPALAGGLILAARPALHLGDRNFGVWRVVRAAAARTQLTATRGILWLSGCPPRFAASNGSAWSRKSAGRTCRAATNLAPPSHEHSAIRHGSFLPCAPRGRKRTDNSNYSIRKVSGIGFPNLRYNQSHPLDGRQYQDTPLVGKAQNTS